MNKNWGNYPKQKTSSELFNLDRKSKNFTKYCLPYGNGRSYGDSCLSKKLIEMKQYNKILNFDKDNGSILVESGILISDIIDIILPQGWFLQIVPGTKYVSIGGAIASDIHGKNHHKVGAFSSCINWFELLLPNDEIVKCSKDTNIELFRSTCGGMGLTGIILNVSLQLKRVYSSTIKQTIIKSKNLKETFNIFDSIDDEQYSVAWIDCLSKGKKLGRSLIMYGDFCQNGNLNHKKHYKFNIPFYFPSFLLNSLTIKIFNFFYYHRILRNNYQTDISFDKFFFPLDSIENWNKMYGENGFTQYQFVLPLKHSFNGMSEILKKISESGKGSFLAVLKLFGKKNNNYMSFPMEGYTLALDFKIEEGIFDLLNTLDEIVEKYEGRIYLAKDARINESVFKKGYPGIEDFNRIRRKYKLINHFHSAQSKRLNI